jgi:hypothetical protein
MQAIVLYFLLALVVIGGVMLAVPDENPAPPPNPHDIMLQLQQAPQKP